MRIILIEVVSFDLKSVTYCNMKISIFVFIFMFLYLSTIHSVSAHWKKRNINWNGNNWAFSCDFKGNDLTNVQVRGEDCGGRCA